MPPPRLCVEVFYKDSLSSIRKVHLDSGYVVSKSSMDTFLFTKLLFPVNFFVVKLTGNSKLAIKSRGEEEGGIQSINMHDFC